MVAVSNPDLPTTSLTRRQVLGGVAVLSVVIGLGACGGSADDATTGESPAPTGEPAGSAAGLGGEPVEVWRDPG